tara:strand:- start:1816 stop:2229 length:414 start_codon:yes stop_codon:yes gene_type:complete
MKRSQFHTLTIIFVSLLVFTACSKKDRNPILIVTIQDVSGTPVEGAKVHVWPTDDLPDDSLSSGVPDIRMDQTGLTDAAGEIVFNFPASAVLDIDVTYTLATSDSTTIDLEGHKVVKIETIEQKEEENIFTELVYIE